MTENELKSFIEKALEGSEVLVRDLTGDGNHFEAEVTCALFEGKSRLQQQRMVMEPLSELLKGPLHALTIKTFTRR